MTAKLTFLGTGGDAIVVGRQVRASGGIVLEIDDNQFHIDPGPGALVRMKQFDIHPRNTTAVLVSHNHINHCNDVNAVIEAMTHAGLDRKGVLIGNKTLFEGTENSPPYITPFHKSCLERFIIMEPDKKIAINDVEIISLPAKHTDPHTVGFKFITSLFSLVYSADTGYDPSLLHNYKGADILILNVQNPGDLRKEFHLCTEDAIAILEQVRPRLTIITHFGIKMMNEDPLHEARTIKKRTKCDVLAAKDGLTLNPESYLLKPLNLY